MQAAPQAIAHDLLSAVQSNDFTRVQQALAARAQITAEVLAATSQATNQPIRNFLLTYAAMRGQTDAVRDLIQKAAMLNSQDQAGQSPLYFAVLNNHQASIGILLQAGAPITSKVLEAATTRGNQGILNLALAHAVQSNDSTLALKLLNAGTVIFPHVLQSIGPATAPAIKAILLCFTASRGDLQQVSKLLELGADINSAIDGKTPLCFALVNKHSETVVLLLQKGAIITEQALNCVSPASPAVIKETLLKAATERGQKIAALYLAAIAGQVRLVGAMLDQGTVPSSMAAQAIKSLFNIPSDPSAFIEAIYLKNTVRLRQLLKLGANPNLPGIVGISAETEEKAPLALAMERAYIEGAIELLQAGAAITPAIIEQAIGYGPESAFLHLLLTFSGIRGDAETTLKLLQNGANPNFADASGQTALYFAVKNSHADVINLLRANGANITDKVIEAAIETHNTPILDAKMANGNSALVNAAEAGQLEQVQALVTAGADINKLAQDDRSALSISIARGHTAVAEFLLAQAEIQLDPSKEGVDSALIAAAKTNSPVLARLLEAGANINHIGKYGLTALIAACESNQPKAACKLLDNCPDMDSKYLNHRGGRLSAYDDTPVLRSALHWAAFYRNFGLVNRLLNMGANARIRDKDGQTPLSLLVQRPIKNELQAITVESIVHCLINHGADIRARDEFGETAYDIAQAHGYKMEAIKVPGPSSELKFGMMALAFSAVSFIGSVLWTADTSGSKPEL
ncbi:MAG: ankyrin repeat protein [Gammaproteobacteria bacterium]|nr:ankyrin repeat protein [Gammaproteobacteria bacterium]